MTALRKLAVSAAAGVVPLLLTALVAGAAQAHGAMDDPVSRVAACGPEGGQNAQSSACKAAVAANGSRPFDDWDNLRVANVAGRDRERIPDGKLCSAGLAGFRGLDLARPDWPATKLSAGSTFTFRYKETIAHKGTFRLYLTRDGYDPSHPLTWSDLEQKPFLSVTDPTLTNNAYVFGGRLPAGRSGHHVIYTIWQNSSTPDTYYSCSGVLFGGTGPGQAAAPPAPTSAPPANATGDPTPTPPATSSEPAPAVAGSARPVAQNSGVGMTVPIAAGGAALLVLVAVVVILRRRRRA